MVVGAVGGGHRAYGENLKRAIPVQGVPSLQLDGVGVLSGGLADGGSGVVDPGPTGHGDE